MKGFCKTTGRGAACAVLACLVLCFSATAFAADSKEILVVQQNQTITGQCCFLFNEAVSITEPAKTVPVVVTWTTDVQVISGRSMSVGVSVNGFACKFFQDNTLAVEVPVPGGFTSRGFQWMILPGDGLRKGNNTFALCGGGINNDVGGNSVTLGFNSLAARIAN